MRAGETTLINTKTLKPGPFQGTLNSNFMKLVNLQSLTGAFNVFFSRCFRFLHLKESLCYNSLLQKLQKYVEVISAKCTFLAFLNKES